MKRRFCCQSFKQPSALLLMLRFFILFLFFSSSSYLAQAQVPSGPTCKCSQYLYLNDADAGLVHKFKVNTDGTLTEMGNGSTGSMPWFPNNGELPSPHGLGQDLNGNLYIGERSSGNIRRLSCDGTIKPTSGAGSFLIFDGGYNFISKDGILYVNRHSSNKIVAYKICDGAELGFITLTGVPVDGYGTGQPGSGLLEDWGFYIAPNGTFYASAGFFSGTYRAYKFTAADFTPTGTAIPTFINVQLSTLSLPSGSLGLSGADNTYSAGIVADNSGNIYQVVQDRSGGNRHYILKFNSAGTLIDAKFDEAGGMGWHGTQGIEYNPVLNVLYLAGLDECITVIDPATLTRVGGVPNPTVLPSPSAPKGLRMVTECCPTSPVMAVDTVVCGAKVGDRFFLQQLIGSCDGPICGGDWTPDPTNTGIDYNACDNSITVTSLTGCGSFSLKSLGGANSQCGAFDISVRIGFGGVSSPVVAGNQTVCPGGDPAAFTVTTAASGTGTIAYQWQSSTTSCTDGYTNIGGATAETYDAPAGLTTTTYYRVVTSTPSSCVGSMDRCKAVSNCITVAVSIPPVAPSLATAQPTCTTATGTISITAPTGTGLQFSFDNGVTFGTSATSNALASGMYQVKVKDSNGCESLATPVTINNQPATPAKPSDVTRSNPCPATQVDLSDLIVSGQELYDNNTRTGTAKVAADVNNITTNATFFLFAKSADGCYSAPATVTVTIVSCAKPLGAIGDKVFVDANKDGKQDPTEMGVDGVTVNLLDASGSTIATTTTANGGKYLFDKLPAGSYTVEFVKSTLPSIYSGFTAKDTAGVSEALNSDADKITGRTEQVVLNPVLNPATAADSAATFNFTLDAGVLSAPDVNCVTSPPTSVLGPNVFVCKGEVYPTLKATISGTGTVDWFKKPMGGAAIATGTLEYKPTGIVAVNDTFYLASRSTLPSSANCPDVSERTQIIVIAQTCADTVDLALRKFIDKKIAKVGDIITYTIKVWNQSNKKATGVEVADSLSAGVQYVSSTATRGSYDQATNAWTIGDIAANGDTVTLTIQVKVLGQGVWFNTAQISKTNEKDRDSTPGNNKDLEDDLDRQCFTVPVELCVGQGVMVSVPANYTGVVWKDAQGSVVPSNGNELTITKAGTYTFTANNGGCPSTGCCPLIVQEINCCPAELCVPFVITKNKK